MYTHVSVFSRSCLLEFFGFFVICDMEAIVLCVTMWERRKQCFAVTAAEWKAHKNAYDNTVGKNPFLEGLILLTRTHFSFCF